MPVWLVPLLPTLIEKMPGFVLDMIHMFAKSNGAPTDADWETLIANSKTTYGFEAGH